MLFLTGNNSWSTEMSLGLTGSASLRLSLPSSALFVVAGAVSSAVLSITGAGHGVTLSNGSQLVIAAGRAMTCSAPLTLQAESAVIMQPSAVLTVTGQLTVSQSSVTGSGTLYLPGGSTWSAGSAITCAVQLSSGAHTLYDLNLQTWTPSSLVAGQPTLCDFCYTGPTIVITPSSSTPLPTASVSAYLGRITFYGVQDSAPATLSVSSSTVLSIGVLDSIVSTSGYGGPPHYTIQSADANVTTVVVATLSAAAFSMTLVSTRLVSFSAILSGLSSAQTLTLRSSSMLVIPSGGVFAIVGSAGSTPSLSIPYVAVGNVVQSFGVMQVSGAGGLSIGTCFINNGSVSTTTPGTLTLNAPAGACNAAPQLHCSQSRY